MKRALAPLLFLVVIACGGAADSRVRPEACDLTVLGACVVGASAADAPHVERQLRLALSYWNAPDDALAGWAVVFGHDAVPCPVALGSGCTWWDANRTVEVQALDPNCLETAQLVHEVGHVLHHDPGHAGPWWNWNGEQDQTWEIVRSPGASPGCAASRYYVTKPHL